ncbi:MAG: GntR family transcriptional regulator [Proteobacteria bacterium]|nr:GntR family transcriptional regulator [Pseudomonadota bacterium]
MLIKLNLSSPVPIYQQLKEQIVEGIASGDIVPGEELPSVRRLAADLSINLHTVNKAYNQLKQDGFLSVHRNRGAVVNAPDDYRADENYAQQLSDSLRPIIAEASCRGLSIEDIVTACRQVHQSLQGAS